MEKVWVLASVWVGLALIASLLAVPFSLTGCMHPFVLIFALARPPAVGRTRDTAVDKL
jgi:hypothetical protein